MTPRLQSIWTLLVRGSVSGQPADREKIFFLIWIADLLALRLRSSGGGSVVFGYSLRPQRPKT